MTLMKLILTEYDFRVINQVHMILEDRLNRAYYITLQQ